MPSRESHLRHQRPALLPVPRPALTGLAAAIALVVLQVLPGAVASGSPPVAGITLSSAAAITNQTLTFRDNSTDVDGDIIGWAWDFADGNTSNTRNTTHRFASPGSYNVSLNVSDRQGHSSNASAVVHVSLPRVHAFLGAEPSHGKAPFSVNFTLDTAESERASVQNWVLDFGDGTNLSGPGLALPARVAHTYRQSGPIAVVLETTDAQGVAGIAATQVIGDAPSNRPPSPAFTVLPTAIPRKGENLRFEDASTDPDPGDAPASWSWSFGDGAQACCLERTVDHAYAHAGSFNASLKVMDSFGGEASTSLRIEVQGRAPSVRVATNTTFGRAPLPVAFSYSAHDFDGTIERWRLDYGDGSPSEAHEGTLANGTFRHVYEQPGHYQMLLRAIDDDGLVGQGSAIVDVAASFPEPLQLAPSALTASPTGQRLTYAFSVATTMAGNLNYLWSFGDGHTGAGKQVEYSYNEAGHYNVTLNVSDERGPVARGALTLEVVDEAGGGGARLSTRVANHVIQLSWEPDSRAVGYQVWRRGPGEAAFRSLGVVNDGNTTSDQDVSDGATYAYQVTFFSADGSGRLDRLSQLNNTEAYRRIGQATATALVDSDGDGVGDSIDAYPQDPTRWVGGADATLVAAALAAVAVLAYFAWRERERLARALPRRGGAARAKSRPLTHIPGLLREHAAILHAAGIGDVQALAAADPAALARATVLPLRRLEPWHAAASLLQVPGIRPEDAAKLAQGGIRGASDLARADPVRLAGALSPPMAPEAVGRWVRAARRSLHES